MKKRSIQFLTLAIVLGMSIENVQAKNQVTTLNPAAHYAARQANKTMQPTPPPKAPKPNKLITDDEYMKLTEEMVYALKPNLTNEQYRQVAEYQKAHLSGNTNIIQKPIGPVPTPHGKPQEITISESQTPIRSTATKTSQEQPAPLTTREQLAQISREQQLQSNSIFNQKSQQPEQSLNFAAQVTPPVQPIAAQQTPTSATTNNSILSWFKNLFTSNSTTPARTTQRATTPQTQATPVAQPSTFTLLKDKAHNIFAKENQRTENKSDGTTIVRRYAKTDTQFSNPLPIAQQ